MEVGHGPWHSVNSGIYHDNPKCQTGNSIAPENIRAGTGDGRLCEECARLNDAAGPVIGPAAGAAADPTGDPRRGVREEVPPPPLGTRSRAVGADPAELVGEPRVRRAGASRAGYGPEDEARMEESVRRGIRRSLD